jgi:ribosomal protein S18 acetylase RimI-like enzyme
MKYREMQANEMSRIGEVNREELVSAEYVSIPDPSGFGLKLIRSEIPSPAQTPHWNKQGIEGRAKSWKPFVEQGGFFYGAFDKDQLVGFVILGPKRRDDSGEIVALFVDRDHRRVGIASELMRKAEEEAKNKGISSLFLYSNPTESSVNFYLRSGYQVVGLISKEIVRSLPGDVLMAKHLESV